MSRLSLVVADLDRDYLSRLERFLMVNYPQRFDIYSFSSRGKLSEFLSNPEKKDILLINGILFKQELDLKNIETVVLLKGDGLDAPPEGMDAVNKYQHAEMLVADILRIYAAKSRKDAVVQGHAFTRVVGVCSAAGGTGKSGIAAGCSVLSSKRGRRAFYLNLEDIPSTGLFFRGESPQSFSNVLYHLKGKGGSLGLKLEGAKCCDPETGVYYFAPPDSALEMDELAAEDISRLILEMKAAGLYDTVIIDLSAGLNQRNHSVLKNCDIIFCILTDQEACRMKTGILLKGMETLDGKYGTALAEKLVLVMNSGGKSPGSADYRSVSSGAPVVGISGFPQKPGCGCSVELIRDTAFLSGLGRLMEYIFPQDEEEPKACAGGGSVG